jgi:hypothetical protein
MADIPQVRRILRMHAAHRTVGVWGVSSPFRSSCRSEPLLAAEPAAATMRVLLAPAFDDGRNHAALAAFERILLGGRRVRCERVDLADVEMALLADADCAVVFGRCLQIVGRWSAFDADADAVAESADRDSGCAAAKIELSDAACWHPVLDGVGPFVSRIGVPALARLCMNATSLLIARLSNKVVPVVWARHGDNRAVCTSLSNAEDLRQPQLARLLQNAIDWVGCDQ